MSTTAVITVRDQNRGEDIVQLLQFGDGRPEYVLPRLKAFLNRPIVNGFAAGQDHTNVFNGAGHLAFRLVREWNYPSLYLQSPVRDCTPEYSYEIRVNEEAYTIQVWMDGIPVNLNFIPAVG